MAFILSCIAVDGLNFIMLSLCIFLLCLTLAIFNHPPGVLLGLEEIGSLAQNNISGGSSAEKIFFFQWLTKYRNLVPFDMKNENLNKFAYK